MKFEADTETAEWLATRPVLQFDAGNEGKSAAKHATSDKEIASMFEGRLGYLGRIVETRSEPRWVLLGTTKSGKKRALIFTRRGDYLRPISCRAMRKKEKALYGEDAD